MHCLSLSADGALLAAVGKDRRGAQTLAVWDVTKAGAAVPSCPLLDARASLVHIKAIQWVPADPLDAFQKEANGEGMTDSHSVQLITCGYENVRFWRLRRGKLHACGMELQHEEGTMFLSIALDDPKHGGGGRERQKQRRMLVGELLVHAGNWEGPRAPATPRPPPPQRHVGEIGRGGQGHGPPGRAESD